MSVSFENKTKHTYKKKHQNCFCAYQSAKLLPSLPWINDAFRLGLLEEVNFKGNCILGGIPHFTLFHLSFLLGIEL